MKRESVTVLEECIDLQKKKSQDYQNPNSNIVQAMHYRRGLSTIHDMINQKMLRAQSLLEPIESGAAYDPNFESLEDTYKDLINYASFAVAYIRGKMEGQDEDRDMLNRKFTSPTNSIEIITRRSQPTSVYPVTTVCGSISPATTQCYNQTVTYDIGDRMDQDLADFKASLGQTFLTESKN